MPVAPLTTTFPTWVNYPGSPSTPGASDLNAIQDSIRFLARPPMATARRSFPVSVPHSTESTIRFDQTWVDTDDMHSTGGSVAEYFTINTTGVYVASFTMIWDAPAGGASGQGWRMIKINRQPGGIGAPVETLARVNVPAVSQPGLGQGMQCVLPAWHCFAGNVFTVSVMHSQGSALNVGSGAEYDATFSIRWVGSLI